MDEGIFADRSVLGSIDVGQTGLSITDAGGVYGGLVISRVVGFLEGSILLSPVIQLPGYSARPKCHRSKMRVWPIARNAYP